MKLLYVSKGARTRLAIWTGYTLVSRLRRKELANNAQHQWFVRRTGSTGNGGVGVPTSEHE